MIVETKFKCPLHNTKWVARLVSQFNSIHFKVGTSYTKQKNNFEGKSVSKSDNLGTCNKYFFFN